jgi:DNA modification methylase
VRGAAADGGKNQSAWGRTRSSLSSDSEGRHTGLARPSNVIDVKSESSQGSHSAPFPRALVEFFLLAFSDEGDVVFDPFLGSGTTMAAAEVLDRVAYCCEISSGYCDVILRRLMNLAGETPVLAATNQPFAEVAAARGVPFDQALNPKLSDSRAIKHNGPNPFYGRKRQAS